MKDVSCGDELESASPVGFTELYSEFQLLVYLSGPQLYCSGSLSAYTSYTTYYLLRRGK